MNKRAAFALAVVCAAAAFVCTQCNDRESAAQTGFTLAVPPDDAWSSTSLPEFELVERSERKVKLADLRGQPFVFDFIFTTCAGPCPVMTNNMRKLQDQLAGSDVRLVSFSVDPPTDTPEVLRRYATAAGADEQRWWFLTGDEQQISKLASSVMLPMQRAPAGEAPVGMQIAHATRFIVVDAKGFVRGMYDGQTEDGVKAAAARARWLGEHPGR